MFELWKEWFPWLLSIAITVIGAQANRAFKKWDEVVMDLAQAKRDIAVLKAGGERREQDRRVEVVDFYGMDKRKSERRWTE